MTDRRNHFTLVWAIGLVTLTLLTGCGRSDAPKDVLPAKSARVQKQLVVSVLSLSGNLQAAQTLDMTSEIDGIVTEKNFVWGEQLQQDAVALRLSTGDIERELRDALVIEEKAKENLIRLKNWTSTPEAARAERAALASARQLSSIDRKIAETNRLLEKGIVARVELDDLLAQKEQLKEQLLAAQDDISKLRESNSKAHRNIAELEHLNASLKVKSLREQAVKAVVHMPTTGTITPSTAQRSGNYQPIEPGSRVRRGDILFRVHSANAYRVSTTADERDVTSLRVGMPATVRLEASPQTSIQGLVKSVGTVPVNADTSSQGEPARYEVLVEMTKPSDDVLRTLRQGMKATVQVETYRNNDALVVPVNAILEDGGASYVEVATSSASPRRVLVRTGAVDVDWVEVFGEVKAGNELVLH